MFIFSIPLAASLIFQALAQREPQAAKTPPEFYIKVEVQGPLALSTDPKMPNVAYIRYGEGYARQTVLLKWPLENKELTARIKKLQGNWVVVTGRMEIGIPPEVRVAAIKESTGIGK
jgi:hypothetical protein